jgi:hypothetical protein
MDHFLTSDLWPLTSLICLAPSRKFGPLGENPMFLKMELGPFVRIPRIFNKKWGEYIRFAVCGLATRARDENQRAKLTVLTNLTVLN